VIWVVLLAAPFLHERAARWNIAAIALLVGGEVALSKGIGHLAWGSGTSLVLAATLLWAVEVVVAKRLLSGIARPRFRWSAWGWDPRPCSPTWRSRALRFTVRPQPRPAGLGPVHRAAAGRLRRHMDDRPQPSPGHRRHVDPGGSALITAALQALAGAQPLAPEWLGLVLITVGTALVAWRMPRHVMAT
jgi:hypothetical protein